MAGSGTRACLAGPGRPGRRRSGAGGATQQSGSSPMATRRRARRRASDLYERSILPYIRVRTPLWTGVDLTRLKWDSFSPMADFLACLDILRIIFRGAVGAF